VRLYVDTADREAAESFARDGLFYGVYDQSDDLATSFQRRC
jgi:hypothetical protein